MNCDRATALLLEADLVELQRLGETELGAHLEWCAACRERARRIVAAEHALDRALAGVPDESRAGRAAPTPQFGAQPTGPRVAGAPVRRRRALRWAWIPIALAAAIGALMLIPNEQPPSGSPAPMALDRSAEQVSVDVPPGRNAVLFATENPNVIVVWFY